MTNFSLSLLFLCVCLMSPLIAIIDAQGVIPCTERFTQPACMAGGGATTTGSPCKCHWRPMSCEASDCQSCNNAGCKWCGLVTGEGYCALPTDRCSVTLPMRTDCSLLLSQTKVTTTQSPSTMRTSIPPGATTLPTPSRPPSPAPTPVPEPTMRGPCSAKTSIADCAQTACNYSAPPFNMFKIGRCVWNRTTSKCFGGCGPPCHHVQSCSANAAVGPQAYCPDGTLCIVNPVDGFGPCLPCNTRRRDIEQMIARCECLPDDTSPISLFTTSSLTATGSQPINMTGDSDIAPIIVGIVVSALLFAAYTVAILWMVGRRKREAAKLRGSANANATKPKHTAAQPHRDTSSRPVANQQQYDVVPDEHGTAIGKYVTMVVARDSGQYDMMPMDRT
jgi:hypothetical protein